MSQNKNGLIFCSGIALCLSLIATPARAANITLQGTFGADDSIQLVNFTVAAPGLVDIRSYGYAGGVPSNGTAVPGGGFDTILTLFNSSGVFINDNDTGSGVATDPITGLAEDARLQANLTPGAYILALTQYDNYSLGNLGDGFVETGRPHFTADSSFTSGGACPGDVFRDISGTAGRCRSGNWTVDLVNVSSAAAVPEPSALLLTGLGLALCVALRGHRFRGVRPLLGAVLALGAASAQTHSDPDFSNVPDYLNGKRSLLKITDIQVVALADLSGPALSTITTSNSQQTGSNRSDSLGFIDASKPLRPFSARMFNQAGDITITPFYDFQHTALLTLWLQNVTSLSSKNTTWTPFTAGDEPTFTAGAVADFTLDGYEELALTFQDGRMLVIAPNDVNDVSKGFKKTVAQLDVLRDLVAGDFDGDGKRELAGLAVTPDGGLKLILYTVDPDTLAVARASSLILTTPGSSAGSPVTALSMARGRFNNAAHDQLAVTFSTSAGPAPIEVIDFAVNTLNPIEKPQLTAAATSIPIGYLQVKTGKFGLPQNGYDQIVFHSSSTSDNGRFFSIVSVDPDSLKPIGGHAGVTYDQFPCAAGVQVGNFDHRQADSNSSSGTVPNLNSQVALLYCNGTVDSQKQLGYVMNIYSVNPDTFDMQGLESAVQLANTYGIAFVETDLQGRSVTLGEPTVITMSSTVQPSVVVGAPPMHIDFISPSPGSNVAPQVLNLSAVPDGFKTTYTQDTSDGSTSSTTGTTSWSWGAKETISASVTIGDVDADAFTAGDTFSAAQDLKGSTDTVTGFFNTKTFKLSDTTGYGDEVSFIDTPFNVWIYPVIGKTVCPKSKPNCAASEQVPVTIQFSAPLKNQPPEAAQGQTLQWYQPPWEPGNIFSYPATLKQLMTIYPNLSTLATGTAFLTDSSTITQSTQWDTGNKDGGTTSFNQNYSFDNDYSATGDIGEKGVAQAKISGDFNVSGSFGFSNLTKTTTTLATSTGLETSKPGAFPSPDLFAYSVTPYIMGTTVPGGVVDNKPLRADVNTFGVLRALYTADPLVTNAGKWWKQAYGQAPDVALNHPARWVINTPAMSNPLPSNCLAGTGEANCADLGQRIPTNPWLSEFHYMRGFFISNASTAGQGPQLEHAKNTDVLTLQARVYNYSLKKMPDGSNVHVRFYFAPWGETSAVGDSVLIGESVIPPISPFSDIDGEPLNWTLASTTFDISKYAYTKTGNVSVAFWVVVWIQDANNQLVGEMPGHGLTAIPGATLKSIADVAEECQVDGKCYSNNVGFFPQAFYIDAPSLSAVPGPSLRTNLDISKVDLSASQTTPGSAVVVSASLFSAVGPTTGISANFYDGDPNNKGRLVNVQRVPHINANHQHGVQALFRTNTCGVHQIFVVVNKGTPSEVVRRAAPLRVNCPAR